MDFFGKKNFTNIPRDILYYHAKCQSISSIRTAVMVRFLFLDFRQSRTLIMGLFHFCSPLPIAWDQSSKAQNLSFSLLQLGLATFTSTAGQGQRLGPVVMVKFYLNLLAVSSQKQSFSALQFPQVFRYIPNIDLGGKGANKSNIFNIFTKKTPNSKKPIILCAGLSE